ncbi:MAG: aldo/keto reductase [Candidatus Omnitrophica bacterium]|nr:aldo/keto reductase [Candidatus Omnitrophota bacterium]
MQYKKLPNADLNISVISLGTWVFGGDVFGKAEEKDCIEAVHAAIDNGINLIDTAPIYGYGASEKIVGKAIKGKRDKVIIATKCGLKGKGPGITIDLSANFIKQEIENSLKRLETDYIDLYQCHWYDANTPMQETMNELCGLQKQGKIKYIGISNFTVDAIKEAQKYADIKTLQGHYSLLERSIEKDILPYCQQKNIGIITYGSLGGGILSGKYEKEPKFAGSDARSFFYKFYKGAGFEQSKKTIAALKEISERIKKPAAQIALNWIRQKPGILSAIAGARNSIQAAANAASADWELSPQDIKLLDNAL